jgi:hypothetical protein
MGGIILSFDDNECIIPKCGYKKKDGSIIFCQECVNKIQKLQLQLSQLQSDKLLAKEEVLKVIDKWWDKRRQDANELCEVFPDNYIEELKVKIEEVFK